MFIEAVGNILREFDKDDITLQVESQDALDFFVTGYTCDMENTVLGVMRDFPSTFDDMLRQRMDEVFMIMSSNIYRVDSYFSEIKSTRIPGYLKAEHWSNFFLNNGAINGVRTLLTSPEFLNSLKDKDVPRFGA